jgi:hypothetical protein
MVGANSCLTRGRWLRQILLLLPIEAGDRSSSNTKRGPAAKDAGEPAIRQVAHHPFAGCLQLEDFDDGLYLLALLQLP